MKISMLMAKDEIQSIGLSGEEEGQFMRIDTKSFSYFVLLGADKKEQSFLWFHQFAGSEKFITNPVHLKGKNVKIDWQEAEVYMPG